MPGRRRSLSPRPRWRSAIGLGPYPASSRNSVPAAWGKCTEPHDATLDREVAIKVLPSLFTSDPQRIERLEREARLLASLNHPNIATIHGRRAHTRNHALALEFVEGETLAERAARPRRGRKAETVCLWRTVLSIARPIADALEAAQRGGIVHRDLKPANVMIARRRRQAARLRPREGKMVDQQRCAPDLPADPGIAPPRRDRRNGH